MPTFDLIIDFAHNPAGVQAALRLARALMVQKGYERLAISLGQAGDRTDDAILGLSKAVVDANPDQVMVRSIAGYERGRGLDDVAELMQQQLTDLGFDAQRIEHCADEVTSMKHAHNWSRGNDLVLHLIHIQREPVATWLAENQATIVNVDT